jgi:dienelactone hydrolase
MHKIILILGFLLSLQLQTKAQTTACDSFRYTSDVFVDADESLNVLFGNNTTVGGNNQDLFMDVFEPQGDTLSKRPTIVLAFGGSFIGGNKDDVHDLCLYYTRKGYVAVAVDYRLYDGPFIPFPNAAVMTDEVVKAVSDMKAAIRYLRQDAATNNFYKIDTNKIFAGGISAGGILASHLAYLDSTDNYDSEIASAIATNGGWNGNSSSNFQYSSEVQGVINFSGALKEASYIDNNAPPLFSVHDDNDGTVPYAAGSATIFGFPIIALEGSSLMHERADSMNVYNRLITIPSSSGHVSYFGGSSWRDSVETSSCVFMKEIICSAVTAVETIPQKSIEINVFPNPVETELNIQLATYLSAYDVYIYDNLGRLVSYTPTVTSTTYQFSTEAFSNGLYYIQIQFEDKTIIPVQKAVLFR